MSEKWKNLLASSRLVAKGLDESSDKQIQASIESLSANFRDMLSLLNNYLTMISKYSEEDSENADQERTKRVEITINCRQALRFTLCLLSIESTREMVQNQACLTYEMHKPLSKLISQRKCDIKCQLMAAQVLCNIVTSNTTTANKSLDDIYSSPTESEIRDILLEKVSHSEHESNLYGKSASSWAQMIQSSGGSGNRNILGAVIAALYNGIMSLEKCQDGPSHIINTAKSLTKDTILMCNMIRYMLPSEAIRPSADESIAAEASDLSDEGTEWISRLMEKFSTLGMLPNIYRSLGPKSQEHNHSVNESESISSRIVPEQLVFLHCIGSAVQEYTRSLHSVNHCEIHPLGGAQDVDEMTATFSFLAKEYCDIRRKLKAVDKKDTEHYSGENACLESAMTLYLDILSDSFSVDEEIDGKQFVNIRHCIGQTTDVIEYLLLDLGVLVDKLGIENRGLNARELKMDESVQHLVTTIVRLVGNICYRCPDNQDLIRNTKVPLPNINKSNFEEYAQIAQKGNESGERNGLHVLLSCTSFAYGCFTLREWSIVAIRNVLEGNEENQKVVEELEAQQALDTPELRKLGVKVNLDKRGQVKVTHHQEKKLDEPKP